MNDTGKNVPEGLLTLLEQQRRMLVGKRAVQMFPVGTIELNLPEGYTRLVTKRGVFHFDPARINADVVATLSAAYRENVLLELGPFNKADVLDRLKRHEKLICLVEYTKTGVEVRTAVGTDSLLPTQLAYFEKTKDDGNYIVVGPLPTRVNQRINGYA